MITTVVFDIGNVLIDFEWDRYVRKLFDEETAEHVTGAMFGNNYWHELDRGVIPEDEVLELFCSNAPDYREQVKEAYDRVGECVEKLDWPVPLMEDLRKRGYRTLFLSNMSEHVMGSNPEAYDFTEHMDGGIWSCRAKLIKPDPAIFIKLFEDYGLEPEECIFVDDRADNIAAAKKLGMKGIIFKDCRQLFADLDKALEKDGGHDKISVLCYGDSNTYGYDPCTYGRYPYERRWTSILQEKLGDHYEVISEGLNGRTTAYDRPGAAWKNGISSFIACLGTHKPVDHVILMLGTNDCHSGLGLKAEDIAHGMETLVGIIEQEAPGLQGYIPEITVAVPAPISGDLTASPFGLEMTEESAQKSRDIEPLYREIAERHYCGFVSAAEGVEVSADCLHLTENGHAQMADLMYHAVKGGKYTCPRK